MASNNSSHLVADCFSSYPGQLRFKCISNGTTMSILGEVFQLYMLGFIDIIGIVLNFLTFLTFIKGETKMTSQTTLLLGLAVADSVYLLINFIWIPVVIIDFKITNDVKKFSILDSFYGLYDYVRRYSVLMVLLVTFDRFLAVYFPLKALRYCTKRMAFIHMGILALVNALFQTFEEMMYKYFEHEDGKGIELFHFRFFVWFLVTSFLPIIGVFVLNILILRAVRKSTSFQSKSTAGDGNGKSGSSRSAQDRFLTRRLLAVSTFFLVCSCPLMAETLVIELESHGVVGQEVQIYIMFISTVGLSINSGSNFFIYILTGKKFRKTIKSIVCFWMPKSKGRYKETNMKSSDFCNSQTIETVA